MKLPLNTRTRPLVLALAAGGGLAAVLVLWLVVQSREAELAAPPPLVSLAPLQPDPNVLASSELARWPWPGARALAVHRGVTHWFARQKDGTTLDLLCFDFKQNPRLRFGLYSQDEDDVQPWDNKIRFWPMGVGQAVRHLNQRGQGTILAAWNGPFFGYYHFAAIPEETAFHLAPVVIEKQVHHNRANHRWTFGVKYDKGQPRFETFHMAGRKILQQFDYASGTLQCLIKDGKPLKLQPFPQPGQPFAKQPFPSTPDDAGHVPYFDHAKFSRASIGWSKDSQQLYMLLVREPNIDSEGDSIRDLMHGRPQAYGWNVPDLQRFWKALMARGLVWNAVNSDAGDVAQLAFREPNGKYMLVSPVGVHPNYERREFDAKFANALQGGGVMYFWVKEESQ